MQRKNQYVKKEQFPITFSIENTFCCTEQTCQCLVPQNQQIKDLGQYLFSNSEVYLFTFAKYFLVFTNHFRFRTKTTNIQGHFYICFVLKTKVTPT